jgi:hypothetical protein
MRRKPGACPRILLRLKGAFGLSVSLTALLVASAGSVEAAVGPGGATASAGPSAYDRGGEAKPTRPPIIELTDFCTRSQIASNIAACGQQAIEAAQALASDSSGGAIVHLRADYSPYRLIGTLTVTSSFVTLKGDGKQATQISCANLAADCIRLGAWKGGRQIRDSGVADLGIFGPCSTAETTCTSGAAIHIQSVYRPFVTGVDLEHVHRGVDIDTNNNSILLRDDLVLIDNADADYGVYWHDRSQPYACGTGACSTRSDVLYLDNVTTTGRAGAYSGTGLRLDGMVNTVVGDGVHLLKHRYGMRVANTMASASAFPAFGNLHDVEIEGATVAGLSIEAGYEWKFTDSDITNSSGSSGQGGDDAYAVQCLPDSGSTITRGLMIANSRIGNSAKSGAFLNCRDVQLTNVEFFSTSASGSGAYPVIAVGPAARDVTLSNITCEEFGGRAKASQCIDVAAGARRISAGGINPQYTNASPWYSDANSPSVLNFQVPALTAGTARITGPLSAGTLAGGSFSPAGDGASGGVRVDQNGVTNWKVTNGTRGSTSVASLDVATGTAGAYEQNQLVDNSGAPFAKTSFGPAVKGWAADRPLQLSTYVYAAPTAGQTVIIGDQQDVAILNPAGPLTSLTVQLPTCSRLYDGKRVGFSTTQAITPTLIVRATAGAVRSAPATAPADTAYRWECVGAQAVWYLSP